MSVCNDCTGTKKIARCTTNLIIGTISNINTAVYVYIKDNTLDDRIIRYAITSSGAGLITIPITPQRFSEDHTYEIWVTLTTASNIETKLDITIGTVTNTCVNLNFATIWTNDNTVATYTNQTLSLSTNINTSTMLSYQATAVDTITTNLDTDVLATGMTLTPPAGTYLVWFSGSAESSINVGSNAIVFVSIYSDGSQIVSSEQGGSVNNTPGGLFPFNCVAKVTVNGSQAIEGKWRVDDALETATMYQRNLTILKVD